MLFFSSGIHKKQVMKLLNLPFGFMHFILCTKGFTHLGTSYLNRPSRCKLDNMNHTHLLFDYFCDCFWEKNILDIFLEYI
jgi:hypothetical protein